MKQAVLIGVLVICLAACKTQEVGTGDLEEMKAKELINAVEANTFDYAFLSGSAKVQFTDSSGLPGVRVSFRMQKDQVIWLSVSKFITVAKGLITPDSIKGINKLDRTYIAEPFNYIQQQYGLAVDFAMLQKVLAAGLPITDHKTLEADSVENQHRLRGSHEGISYEIFINPQSLTISRMVMIQENSPRKLDVSYDDFKTIDGGPFPHHITIKASGDVNMAAELNVSSVQKAASMEFPFEIPSNYTPM